MKGLEVTVLSLSQVLSENRAFRVDAQYFSREALAANLKVLGMDHETVKTMCRSVQSFGAYALTNEFEYQESGIPFLRGLNIKGGFVDFSNCLYIDAQAHALLPKSAVKPGMVLMTMSGTLPKAVKMQMRPNPLAE